MTIGLANLMRQGQLLHRHQFVAGGHDAEPWLAGYLEGDIAKRGRHANLARPDECPRHNHFPPNRNVAARPVHIRSRHRLAARAKLKVLALAPAHHFQRHHAVRTQRQRRSGHHLHTNTRF